MSWKITEGDKPPRVTRRYGALWNELLLRLERTPASRWLHIEVSDEQEYLSLSHALYKRVRESNGVIEMAKRSKQRTVYVRRGPNWAARDAGSLAYLSEDARRKNGASVREEA